MKRNAVALRAFTHSDDESYADGETILDMDAGQFANWSGPGVDLVREATAAEVARAKGETAPAKPKAKKSTARKPAAKKLAPAPAPTPDPLPDPAPETPVEPADGDRAPSDEPA